MVSRWNLASNRLRPVTISYVLGIISVESMGKRALGFPLTVQPRFQMSTALVSVRRNTNSGGWRDVGVDIRSGGFVVKKAAGSKLWFFTASGEENGVVLTLAKIDELDVVENMGNSGPVFGLWDEVFWHARWKERSVEPRDFTQQRRAQLPNDMFRRQRF